MEIRFNNVAAQTNAHNTNDKQAFDFIRREFKVKAPGADYMKTHRLWKKTKGKQGWNGLVNILEPTGYFPTGLLPDVMEALWKRCGIVPSLIDQRVGSTKFISQSQINLRDYQFEALKLSVENKFQGMWWPRGIIKIATGGGKTEVAVSMYETVTVPTLFIVHLKSLGYQAEERFKKYGHRVGTIFDGRISFHRGGITVATIHSLMRNIESREIRDKLKEAEQVFFDEAHLIAAKRDEGNWFTKVSKEMPNAFFRWGLTATPFMKDTYSNRLLFGATGDILHEVKSKELVDAGWLAPVEVTIIDVPKVYKCPRKWPDCFDSGVVLNDARTRLVAEQLRLVPKPAFVLTTQIAHAKILKRACEKNNKVALIMGEHDQEYRESILKDLENGRLDAAICTTVFDEGIDFPELRSVILAGGGKSEIKQIQRVGRGMRPGKDKLIVIDFMDNSAATLKKHSKERIRIYEEEGYDVGA